MPDTAATTGTAPLGPLSEEDKQSLFLAIAQSVITNPLVRKLTTEMTDGALNVNANGEG